MLSEESFLSDIYSEYIDGNEYEQCLAASLDDNVRWRVPGSTVKAKYFVANSLKRFYRQEILNTDKINVYLVVLDEIKKFQKGPYIKGDGCGRYA